MGNCKMHGNYSNECDLAGMGCPACYKASELESTQKIMQLNNSCSKCKKNLIEIDKTYDGEPILERFAMHYETGYQMPDIGDWETERTEFHLCKICYEKFRKWLNEK